MVIDTPALIAMLATSPTRRGSRPRSSSNKARIEVVPFDQEQAELARDAYRRYGKGHHPAGLSYGDCFAYALCSVRGESLLFKGDDFAKTDVRRALDPV
ncbi:MAG TPA: type II toxin-antitoxin system VapC family toxin [Kofleriaceae bacterium]|nr:type II toxin-antitoxin system VapC family toxin [Kofleriaceae bacterium]